MDCGKPHRTKLCKPVRATQIPDSELRVAWIIRDNRKLISKKIFPDWNQLRVLDRLSKCRTEDLRSHLWKCTSCNYEEIRYNSCQNRYCPTCYTIPRSLRIAQRKNSMLRVPHSLMTFVPPSILRSIAKQSPREFYNLFFRSASQSLIGWCKKKHDARPGLSITTQTWTKNLNYHPHQHAQMTNGGLSSDSTRWISFDIDDEDLQDIQGRFKTGMIKGLWKLFEKKEFEFSDKVCRLTLAGHFRNLMDKATDSEWEVHKSLRHSGVEDVLRKQLPYLQRPPIKDSQLVSYTDNMVTFKTYKSDTVRITAEDFLKRFIQHILPRKFNSTRSYGLYASAIAKRKLIKAREIIKNLEPSTSSESPSLWDADTWQDVMMTTSGQDPNKCPQCGESAMVFIEIDDVKQDFTAQNAEHNKQLRFGQLKLISDTS